MAKTTKRKSAAKQQTKQTEAPRKARVDYSPELGEQILDHIIDGKTLIEIEKTNGMPSRSVILKWRKQHEDFGERYAEAMDMRADADADEVDDIARRVLRGEIDSNTGRAVIDALKWATSHRAPRRYGTKVSAELSGANGGPIETRDVSPDRLLNLARSMALVLTDVEQQLPLLNGDST